MDKFMMVFSTVLLILNTIFWTTQVYFGQRMWINNPDYPDGIDGYWQDNSSVWYQTWGTTACVASNLMSDALLVNHPGFFPRCPHAYPRCLLLDLSLFRCVG